MTVNVKNTKVTYRNIDTVFRTPGPSQLEVALSRKRPPPMKIPSKSVILSKEDILDETLSIGILRNSKKDVLLLISKEKRSGNLWNKLLDSLDKASDWNVITYMTITSIYGNFTNFDDTIKSFRALGFIVSDTQKLDLK
jgi:hypothetical protein